MEQIRANQIVLVDGDGAPRLILGTTPVGAPVIAFRDRVGNEQMSLSLHEENGQTEAMIRLQAHPEGPIAMLNASDRGGVALTLLRRPGHPLAVLDIEPGEDARPSLTLYDPTEEIPLDANGKARWHPTAMVHLTVTEDPEAYLQFMSKEGASLERVPE